MDEIKDYATIPLNDYHKLNGNTMLKRFFVTEEDNIFSNALDLKKQDWHWIRP